MPTNTWTFSKRWKITAQLRTDSPLHIGNGDTVSHPHASENENVNACIKNYADKPYLPGTTLKGKFRAWLEERLGDDYPQEINALFGFLDPDKQTGMGGKAEFHDAQLITELPGGKNYPCWQQASQTYIETSVAMDRMTRTAAHRKLFHTERVPPNVGFKIIITGQMNDTEAALVLAVLNSFKEPEQAPALGAEDTAGNGRMSLFGRIEVACLDAEQVSAWLSCKNLLSVETAFDKLEPEEITAKLQPVLAKLGEKNQCQRLQLTIQMDGPFLINNPDVEKPKGEQKKGEAVHKPLLDSQGKPLLNGKSLRGALRAQGERILRSLSVECCNTDKPCKAIATLEEVETKLCPACRIFGAGGWQSPLRINHFKYKGEIRPSECQDFVAIDRFHGGGKDGAKFNIAYYFRPQFTGTIEFDDRLEPWGKGLLALVLRDLREGDIKLGFGASKGYGGIEQVSVTQAELLTEQDIAAFRQKFCQQHRSNLNAEAAVQESAVNKTFVAANNPSTPERNNFYNPYQFIPVLPLDASGWLDKEEFTTGRHYHSHGLYSRQDAQGGPIYHGRLQCKLKTETPIFIGSKREEGTAPVVVNNYFFDKEIAIPATSLRGMLSSLAETASNSALRVMENGLLSYRKTTDATKPKDRPLSEIGMIVEEDDNLKLIPFAQKWALKEACSDSEMKTFLEQNSCATWSSDNPQIYYFEFNDDTGKPEGLPIPAGSLTAIPRRLRPCILRILGKNQREKEIPDTKKHEMLIQVSKEFVDDFNGYIKGTHKLTINPKAIQRFEQLANQRTDSQKQESLEHDEQRLPYNLKGTIRNNNPAKYGHKLRLKTGDLVYFRTDEQDNNIVAEIAFSAIWRGRIENKDQNAANVHDFFSPELRPFNPNRNSLSPAELLFGFVEEREKDKTYPEQALAFAGKVRIGAGRLTAGQNQDVLLEHPVTLKILSSPKLPSPALYFQPKPQKNPVQSGYIAKRELNPEQHQPNGRKYYLHAMRQATHPAQVQKLTATGGVATGGDTLYPWQSGNNENPEQKAIIRPIKVGTVFEFYMDFDNLNAWELGLLCYALKPAPSYRHKIGMGKPIGLGSVDISIESLKLIDRRQRYAEDPFDINHDDKAGNGRYNVNADKIPSVDQLRETFAVTMNNNIRKAIEMLGNPHNVKAPVHYPQVKAKNIEIETYQWFVANDSGSGKKPNKIEPKKQPLNPITTGTEQLPTLTRHEWADE